ncbi:MAG: 2-oxoacid:acceptor oxidoreductase family protein [Armatimonadetes bacterium]|nr:2-oxoacid:acceptor oxidoreductase family protein [Armatimonadota bacterium]
MVQAVPDMTIAPKVAIRLSGTGGQGLLLAGRILAEAAAIYDGLNAVQSNSYGPEARGGASRSEVVISPGEVDDLRCKRFDVLLCLSQKACDAYYSSLVEGGVLIVDSTNVTVVPTSRALELPMTRMAIEECGNRVVTNLIAVGAICGYTRMVTLEALVAAVESSLRADLVPMNVKAIKLGYAAAEKFVQDMSEKKRGQVRDYSFKGTQATP